jgi:hypothetical protein
VYAANQCLKAAALLRGMLREFSFLCAYSVSFGFSRSQKLWQKCGVSTACVLQLHFSVTLICGRSHLLHPTLWRQAQTSQLTPVFSIFITSLQAVCAICREVMHNTQCTFAVNFTGVATLYLGFRPLLANQYKNRKRASVLTG